MIAAGWLDVADKTGSVVGAVAGVVSLLVAWRALRQPAAHPGGPRPPAAAGRGWLLLGCALGLTAASAGTLRMGGVLTGRYGWLVAVAALAGGLAATALYVASVRRRPLVTDPALRALLATQLDAGRRHRYDFFDGHVPVLPRIYVEQRGEAAAALDPRLSVEAPTARLTVPEMLNEAVNVIIVADPGMGKSTLVAHIQHTQCDWLLRASRADRPTRAPFGALVPVVLPAVNLVGRDLPGALALTYPEAALPPGALTAPPRPGARWLILVDGLDEVLSVADRSQVLASLAGWLERSDSAHRFVVTSRPLFLGELADMRAQGVVEYRLCPFGEAELTAFARQWFRHRSDGSVRSDAGSAPDSAEAAVRLFLDRIAAARLTGVVRVPLLATIAVLVFENDRARTLPTGRAGLYERFVTHLLHGRRVLDRQMEHLRAEFARSGPAGVAAWSWLEANLRAIVEYLAETHLRPGAGTVTDRVRTHVGEGAPAATIDRVPGWERHVHALLTATGLLVSERGDLVFTHRSVVEYLAAGVRAEHFDEAAWFLDIRQPDTRNLALFVAARRNLPADPLVRALVDSLGGDVVIAGEMLVDGVDVGEALRLRVIDALAQQFAADDPTASDALRVLADLGGYPAVVESLTDIACDTDNTPWVRALAAQVHDRVGGRPQLFPRLADDASFDRDARRWVAQQLGRPDVPSPERSMPAAIPGQRAGAETTAGLRLHAYRQALTEGRADPGFVIGAATVLADHRDPVGVEALWRSARDPDVRMDLRLQAARALLRTDPAYTGPMREHALRPTGRIGDSAPLTVALAERDDPAALLALADLLLADPGLVERLPAAGRVLPAANSVTELPTPWGGVPPRNPNFTGRERELEDIRRALRTTAQSVLVTTQVSVGLGGVGKTQLATEYAYRFAGDYDLVWWIDAEQQLAVEQSLTSLAENLGLPIYADQTETARRVIHALETDDPERRALLVFDNADDPGWLTPYLPRARVHALITSRHHGWEQASVTEIGGFPRADSIKLLRRTSGVAMSDRAADELAERLGDLPLALTMAASWISTTATPVDEYIALLDQQLQQITETPRPVSAAFSLSLSRLRDESEAAAQLLTVVAQFAPEPVPLSLFYQDATGSRLPQPLADVVRSPLGVGRLVRDIARYALARVDSQGRTIQVHRLVSDTIRATLTDDEQHTAGEAARALLAAADPGDTDDPNNWPRYRGIAPHVTAVGLVDEDRPDARSCVLHVIRYRYVTGDFAGSRDLAQLAVDTWTRTAGLDEESTWQATQQLADALRALSSIREAAGIDKDLLDRARRAHGEEHPATAAAAVAYAADLRTLGDYPAARALDADALDAHRILWGDEYAGTLSAAANLARDLRLLGRFSDALALDQRSLQAAAFVYGPEHPLSLLIRAGIVRDHHGGGDYLRAWQVHEEMMPPLRATLDDAHREVLAAERTGSVLLRRLGRLDEAREQATHNLRMAHERFAPGDAESLAATLNLSAALTAAGEYTAAAATGRQASTGYRELFGPDHPLSRVAAVTLASALREMGNLRAARLLNEQSLASLTRVLGPDHPYTLVAATNLASDIAALDGPAEALALDAATYERSVEVRGDAHPDTLTCAANLAIDLSLTGQAGAAAALTERALTGLRAVLGADHTDIAAVTARQRLTGHIDPPAS